LAITGFWHAKVGLNMLIESLNLLAGDYETQINALPDFVHVPDELALIFSDCCLFTEELYSSGMLSELQRDKLLEIDNLLDHMSNVKNLWNFDSLKQSSNWDKVRNLAHDMLKLLDKEKKRPDLYWIKYQR